MRATLEPAYLLGSCREQNRSFPNISSFRLFTQGDIVLQKATVCRRLDFCISFVFVGQKLFMFGYCVYGLQQTGFDIKVWSEKHEYASQAQITVN